MSFADTLDDLEAMNHAPGDGSAPAPKKKKTSSAWAALLRRLRLGNQQKPRESSR